ncbi:MAG: RsmG family class I SAM-dependent methyltransferase [Pseudomonadota bacterium]|nr:RsmG family class I SAM-dependent methyltransferase [Pseudomonadota bacterium]
MVEDYPEWSLGLLDQEIKAKLNIYSTWLLQEGIKKGLISNKTSSYIWEEFIIHSLGFSFIINSQYKSRNICDLGSGAGIPGVPVAITTPQRNFFLVERSKKRYFELERLKILLEIDNIQPVLSSAESFIGQSNNEIGLYISRCFMPKEKIISELFIKNNKKQGVEAILVSSNKKEKIKNKDLFHVKQEKIMINKTKTRNIDVITFK